MAGAYRMALARARVVATAPDGSVATLDQQTVSVRDGQAVAKRNQQVTATMPVAELVRRTGRDFTIVGTDGTTWVVTKPCNCGGSR